MTIYDKIKNLTEECKQCRKRNGKHYQKLVDENSNLKSEIISLKYINDDISANLLTVINSNELLRTVIDSYPTERRK